MQFLEEGREKSWRLSDHYGSWAGGDAGEDSDIDVVESPGEITPEREIDKIINIIIEINSKYNTLISVYPVSEDVFHCEEPFTPECEKREFYNKVELFSFFSYQR